LLASLGIAHADVAPRWSLSALVDYSEIVIIGRIVEVEAAWDVEVQGIYTYVTVDVEEVFKGSLPERRITLKQSGGRAGDVRFEVKGQSSFVQGERALLFLEVRPRDQTLYTTALWQGKWDLGVDAASGETKALRIPADLEDAAGQARDLQSLASVLSGVRAASERGRGKRALRQVRARPVEAPFGTLTTVSKNGFTLLGPARWDRVDLGRSVFLDAQTGGQRGLSQGGVPQILAGLDAWNGAGSSLNLAPGRFRSERCFNSFEGNGRIALAFGDPCDEIDDGGGVLAIGGGFFTDNPTRVVSGQPFHNFLQAGVVFNDSRVADLYLRNKGCFQDTVTHELGHTVGLGHTNSTTSIMHPVITASCFTAPRKLGPSDVSGLRYIYPTRLALSCALPSAPRSFFVLRSGTVLKASWDPPATGKPTGYLVEVGTYSGGSNVTKVSLGNVTSVSGTLPRGTYYLRVRARTACGLGPPSNQVRIVVP
jgi:hypothetical protein